MRIDNTTPLSPLTQPSTSHGSERKAPREDRAQLSLVAQAATDSTKVDELAAAVSVGTYHVPATQIAASMIDETIA